MARSEKPILAWYWSGRLRAWRQYGLALLVMLVLLLNPLACIVHCHLTAVLSRHTFLTTTTIAGQELVICGHAGSNTNVPAPLAPDLLRTLFELAPTHNSLLLLWLLWLLPLSTKPHQWLPQHIYAPPLPPPRRATI